MYRGLGRVCTRGVGGLLPSKATEPWPPLNARNRHGEAIATTLNGVHECHPPQHLSRHVFFGVRGAEGPPTIA